MIARNINGNIFPGFKYKNVKYIFVIVCKKRENCCFVFIMISFILFLKLICLLVKPIR